MNKHKVIQVCEEENKIFDIGDRYDLAKKEMEEFWPKLLTQIETFSAFTQIKLLRDKLKAVLMYNVPDGKKFRGLAFVLFYRSFDDKMKRCSHLITDNHLYAMAWALEILQAACLIADDIVDNSSLRRGKLCWHLVDGKENTALLDVLLLENIAMRIVDKYFKYFPNYYAIMKQFHKTSIQTLVGESLDTHCANVMKNIRQSNNDGLNIKLFTMELYSNIVEFKTSYYTFCLPAELAMILVGSIDKKHMKIVRNISLKIGHLFQVQDDYLDCFGDPEVTGKIGTDIIDGKCTWLIVKAIQLASPEQISLLEKYYATEEHVHYIKLIYEQLSIAQQFNAYEDEAYEEIFQLIENLPELIPTEYLLHILNCIYKREK